MTTETSDRAWVLHRYPYGDTSLVVELFTQTQGRLGVLAKGARRARSPLARLEAGHPLWVRWLGRGELPVLAQAETLEAAPSLGAMQHLSLFYINELLLRLTQRADPFPDFFKVYEATLTTLHSAPGESWFLRRFERRLLENLGWAPDLQSCAECGHRLNPERGERWFYQPAHGAFCPRHAPGAAAVAVDAAALCWLQGAMSTPYEKGWGPGLRHCLEQELRVHLGERPLESRYLLAAYLRRRRLTPKAERS
ncbi:DNA repair protein RecO [Acidithiobacillus ferrianus]|uniref:DNA repair protein RecO n=2 Tax=Acidithiobacillus ferrianus TaxID=2678518 RepID=A0A845U787_9PROT|nr:DNA repair protein RecO [Acidithiobacillus ferrianus]NDU42019.1 DNA repair protein RecO [Acidithiobacillus ferrianus]